MREIILKTEDESLEIPTFKGLAEEETLGR